MKVATLSLNVLFKHPSIDPAVITHALGVQPTRQWRVGDTIIGVDDKAKRGGERDTRWSLWAEFYDDDGSQASERIALFLEPFVRRASFVRQLAIEGYAGFDLNLPGQFHFGCTLAPAVLRAIAELELNLGIEVFPNTEM
jgi:hypothetical protein